MNIRVRTVIFFVAGLAGSLSAQTLADIGTAAPTPGANDIYQLSTQGNTTWPDGINYFTDNNPPVGQTFTAGTNAMNLASVAIKTAGLNSGNGYGTPASTPTYHLRINGFNPGNSLEASVNPLSAPAVGNVSAAGGQFRFNISGQGGPDYAVETSTHLTQWSAVFVTNSPALPFVWMDTNSAVPQRFYRVKLGRRCHKGGKRPL
jgi:hypothetical protein